MTPDKTSICEHCETQDACDYPKWQQVCEEAIANEHSKAAMDAVAPVKDFPKVCFVKVKDSDMSEIIKRLRKDSDVLNVEKYNDSLILLKVTNYVEVIEVLKRCGVKGTICTSRKDLII